MTALPSLFQGSHSAPLALGTRQEPGWKLVGMQSRGYCAHCALTRGAEIFKPPVCRHPQCGEGGACEGCSFLQMFPFCRLLQHRKIPDTFVLSHWGKESHTTSLRNLSIFSICSKCQQTIANQRKQQPSPRCSSHCPSVAPAVEQL